MAGSECHLCCASGTCYFYGFKLQGAVAFYFILVQNKHNSIKKKLHLNIDLKEKRTNRRALGSLPRASRARWEMMDGAQEDLRAFCHISLFKIKIYRNELGTFFKKNKKQLFPNWVMTAACLSFVLARLGKQREWCTTNV